MSNNDLVEVSFYVKEGDISGTVEYSRSEHLRWSHLFDKILKEIQDNYPGYDDLKSGLLQVL
jgi:hypothetical protein